MRKAGTAPLASYTPLLPSPSNWRRRPKHAAVGAAFAGAQDEDLRVSRGDRGNLFILSMADKEAELGDQGWP